MVFATVREGDEEAFERAYEEVTAKVLGTPGHIRDELLRESGSSSYILLSEWESVEKFKEWEDAPVHREVTTPMRPYWAGRVDRKIYDLPVSE